MAPPDTLGFQSAAMGNPEKMMFMIAMPSSAVPRSTSMDEMRSAALTGATSTGAGTATSDMYPSNLITIRGLARISIS